MERSPDDRARDVAVARFVGAAFVIAIASAVSVALVYAFGGQTQWEGVLLGVAFAGIGVGLVVWGHRWLTGPPIAEPWPHAEPDDVADDARADELAELAEVDARLDRYDVLDRRTALRRLLGGAIGAIGVALLFPIRSLGPRPGDALRVTPWQSGSRLVDPDGRIVELEGVPLGGLVTVFPEGHIGAADAAAVLVRTSVGASTDGSGAGSGGPSVDGVDQERDPLLGVYAYSKVCTHAGCPVGLYVDDRQTLLCPCHQSEFDVVNDARPTSGPAARPLPRLPLAVDERGALVATGDFDEPVGPAWWTM